MRVLLFLCTLLWVTATSAQNEAGEVEIAFARFWQANVDKDTDAILDGTYPGLFDLIPREMMQQEIEKLYSDSSILFGFGEYEINKVSKVLAFEDNEYALLDYRFEMFIELKEAEQDDDLNALLLELYREMYGSKNVQFSSTLRRFEIKGERKAYAIRPAMADSPWFFLERKKGMEELLAQLLPKKVVKKLK